MMKKLFIAFLFLLPVNASALTLLELRTNVRLLIKDASTSRQRYTDTQVNNFINEGQRDVINNTWVITKSTNITLVTGTTYYTLPTDTLAIQRVTKDRRNLPETSLIKLDGDSSNGTWENSVGVANSYFQDPSQTDKIGVYPWPNSSSSTGTIKVIYYAVAPVISSDADIPFNGEARFYAYHDLLEYFAAYRVYLLEGEVDKAGLYRQEYESRLTLMAGRIGMKGNYNPSFSAGTKR